MPAGVGVGSQPAEPMVSGVARIVGLDIARAFAIVGMVLVNFKLAMGAETAGPQWLRSVSAVLNGRAAATFVVLAGIGATLGSRRARLSGDPAGQRAARITLAKRALFLFVIGWAFFPFWPADILHYYGVYLAIGSIVLFTSSKRLLVLAGVSVAISFGFIVAFDPLANWNVDDLSYNGILTPAGFLRNLFLDGFHPVFPWITFYLFGMWLGRTDLRDRRWRRTLIMWSAAVIVVTEAASWIALGPKGYSVDVADYETWRRFFSLESMPPMPLYVAAGTATAVLVICGSIWLGNHLSEAAAEPLVSTGQLALSIYLAHVLVGMAVLDLFGRLDDQTLAWATGTGLIFCAAAVLGSWAWRRRFARGPLETVMRRVAG